jgi:hypothetical protein
MHREPFGRAAAAPRPELPVWMDLRRQHKNILDPNRLTGTHYRGNIMRVINILHHHR